MTSEQKRLARHALGLPNDKMVSCRNRYIAGTGETYGDWSDMERSGFAICAGSICKFKLTRAGAERALKPGERLCEEDFPE